MIPVLGTHNAEYCLHNVDLPILPVLVEMEETGVLIDVDRLTSLIPTAEKRIDALEVAIESIADKRVNLNSPLQLAALLFDDLKLRPVNGRSTDKEVLAKLAAEHPVPRFIQEHRRLTKLLSTYIKKIPESVSSDGRLYSHFNNTVTFTGRLSSSKPVNLQNIPVRVTPDTPEALIPLIKEIRKAFIPKPGYKIVKMDQSQVEFRIIVCLGNDEATIEAIKNGRDIHCDGVAIYLNQPYEEVYKLYKAGDAKTKQLRDVAKNVVYGAAYGQTEAGLVEWLNTNGIPATQQSAKALQDGILQSKPGILRYIKSTEQFALTHGYVQSYFGRYMPDNKLFAYDRKIRSDALRTAVNAPIQGTSADIMKQVMRRVWDRNKGNRDKVRTILAVHDELDFECREDYIPTLIDILKETATTVVDWQIPLEIEVGIGNNWGEIEKI